MLSVVERKHRRREVTEHRFRDPASCPLPLEDDRACFVAVGLLRLRRQLTRRGFHLLEQALQPHLLAVIITGFAQANRVPKTSADRPIHGKFAHEDGQHDSLARRARANQAKQ